ncbi:hypothetical protein CFC21_016322 [Triticum aestivum]|uniref:Neprosin PEP catalytic domain-containing protein n=2 Tax=Triticum aestivum TaxID=4565 RepID=A0A3B6AUV1_WHEAT|nr:hypothetical protein CFC21_016322 [Triticum aestivum]
MKRHPLVVVMLFVSFLFFSCGRGRSSAISESDFELERELKMLNKPYVKSFKDNYGVIFDCIDIYKQPAFDHPLLKNHILQFALVLLDSEKGKTFQGASASIEVYYLPMPSNAASTAQMLVVDDRSSNVTVVQAGWHIDPGREGDGQSRLTVYWTADDYKQTGCPNTQCPGFVLVNQYVAPGTAFPAGSSIDLTISRDDQTGHWLVSVSGLIVGYFPRAIVNGMDGSTQVQVGGTVYAPPGSKRPPMGSGIAPGPNSNNGAAKFKWLTVRGSTNFKFRKTKNVDDSSIYDVVVTSASQNGPDGFSFQYGGPGDA